MLNCTLCYIENPRGEYLMLHRVKKKNDVNRDKWIGIGGKFEEGESPEECIRREAREETGLELRDLRFRGLVTFVSDLCPTEYIHIFTAAASGKEALPDCDEGELAWVDKTRLEELPLWEGDYLFLRRLADPAQPFFSMKICYQGDKLLSASLDGTPLPL